MKLKNILMLILALCMVFALCACGNTNTGSETTTQAPETSNTQSETQESTKADDGKVTYTVTVVDEGGNPIVGAFVQMCLDNCYPMATNESGTATFNLEEADYKVSFVTMPVGYTVDVTEFYFAEGSRDLTITLKAAA